MKMSVSNEKFAIEYLRENGKVRETVFACSNRSYRAQFESFKQKNGRKSRDAVP